MTEAGTLTLQLIAIYVMGIIGIVSVVRAMVADVERWERGGE